jgi:peroxiredoxin
VTTVPDHYALPPDLPVPVDDGAAAHLAGMQIPSLLLTGSDGRKWDVASLALSPLVVYVYPKTGVPGRDPAPGWDSIPGAPGCTVQSLGYKAAYDSFRRLGVNVVGLSSQNTVDQREFAKRNCIPFLLISDPMLALADALRFPTFEVGGKRLLKRLALVADRGVVVRAFYPVCPPDENAATVLAWLMDRLNRPVGEAAP